MMRRGKEEEDEEEGETRMGASAKGEGLSCIISAALSSSTHTFLTEGFLQIQQASLSPALGSQHGTHLDVGR